MPLPSIDHLPGERAALDAAACDRSRSIAAGVADLDARCAQMRDERDPVNLRWIFVHLVEEYARHAGHADLIREAIDGQVGDG